MISKLLATQVATIYGGNVCKCNGIAITSKDAEKFMVSCQKTCCVDRLSEHWQQIDKDGKSVDGFCHNSYRKYVKNIARFVPGLGSIIKYGSCCK